MFQAEPVFFFSPGTSKILRVSRHASTLQHVDIKELTVASRPPGEMSNLFYPLKDIRLASAVGMVNIPLFTGFHTSWVVQDFLHQQYMSSIFGRENTIDKRRIVDLLSCLD